MTAQSQQPESLPVADEHAIALMYGAAAFTLKLGHRLRAANCLVCQELIGGHPVSVVGIAALNTEPCVHGCLLSDSYLVHDQHLPIDAEELQAAIHRGLQCPETHE